MIKKALKSPISGNLRVWDFRPSSIRSVQVLSVIGASFVLMGCSSILNIGSPEYACPGMPGGVQCMSAREVYSATNNGNVPLPMRDGEDARGKAAASPVEGTGGHDGRQPTPNDVVANYVAPRLPDQPIPIRTPAQVMRIWVAPWEDANGDLNTTGYIYSEIEPRRWVIGDAVEQSAPVLRPLQSIRYGEPGLNDPAPSGTSSTQSNQARHTAEAATAKASAARQ